MHVSPTWYFSLKQIIMKWTVDIMNVQTIYIEKWLWFYHRINYFDIKRCLRGWIGIFIVSLHRPEDSFYPVNRRHVVRFEPAVSRGDLQIILILSCFCKPHQVADLGSGYTSFDLKVFKKKLKVSICGPQPFLENDWMANDHGMQDKILMNK